MTFEIRASGDVGSIQRSIRAALQQAEPNMPIGRLTTLSDAMNERMVQDRLLARLSIAFGIVALLLSSIGLYGVLSYGVARRTSEIGIRKALGAREGALVAMVLRETGWLFLAGVAAGAALSAATMRLIASRLYGLTPADPVAFAAGASALALVAVLATWLPAYRASRVDPLVALRHE
jgi:ABC-type antimicrobial peptide transport system permease subunit